MKQNLKTIIITTGGILGIATSVFLLTFVVLAWTGPQNTPPTCESGEVGCDAVIHTGSTAQSKVGGLLLNTGGATNGLIVENGNVGIGTDNPGAGLVVNNNDTLQQWISTDNESRLQLNVDTSSDPDIFNLYSTRLGIDDNVALKIGSQDYLELTTNDVERIHIANTGNVGIGTINPGAKLDIKGSVIIDGNNHGARTMNIASFFTNTASGDYIHIRLPFNPVTGNNMFYVEVKGYAYAGTSSKIINLIYVGYAYQATGNIIRDSTLDVGGGMAPYIYKGSDNNVYLRFTPGGTYFLTCVVDSMYVGNGRVILPGEITILRSSSATL